MRRRNRQGRHPGSAGDGLPRRSAAGEQETRVSLVTLKDLVRRMSSYAGPAHHRDDLAWLSTA